MPRNRRMRQSRQVVLAQVPAKRSRQVQPRKRRPQRRQNPQKNHFDSGLAYLGQGVGSIIGGGFGGPAGSVVGAAVGRAGGAILNKVTGLGAYSIKHNSLLGTGVSVVNRNTHPNSVVIRDREYLGDVISSNTASTFSLQSYNLNPGLESTFPKLSQIAANYEEYVIEGMIFEFRSGSGDALTSTNTALGFVVMATTYNASSPPFASKAEMESTVFVDSHKPSVDLIHPIECDPRQTVTSQLYVRAGSVPGQDIKTYDHGIFQIATTGVQGTSVNLGELWVSYQVALLKPRLFSALGNYNEYLRYNCNTGFANATPLGSAPAIISGSTMTPAYPSAGQTVYFPFSSAPQTYLVTYLVTGTAAAIVTPVFSFFNGASVAVAQNGSAFTTIAPPNGVTSATFLLNIYVTVAPNNPSSAGTAAFFSVGTGTLPTAPTAVRLSIFQLPNALTQQAAF
jgi:hypothetical protein